MTQKIVLTENWTLITATDTTSATFQSVGEEEIIVLGTVGANAPSTAAGGLVYQQGQGERNIELSDLFPGISGVNRLYARGGSKGAAVFISHV